MATNAPTSAVTMVAGADLSGSQYRFVKLAADNECDVATDGVQAEGVIQNNPTAGGEACVALSGVVKVVVGTGGLTASDNVASDANGAAITAAAGDAILGVAMEDATAGGFGRVLLNRGGFATA
jgi:hypothetical protein